MGKLRAWLRATLRGWLGVHVLELEAAQSRQMYEHLSTVLDKKIKELDRLTREDWDVSARGRSTIILTGVYRKRGFVKFYDIPQDEFEGLVHIYRDRRKEHTIRNIDAPYVVSGAFDLGEPRT
ncbi:hypothetical protein QMT40_001800 [Parvibaculaceae bacterium PLY_AMNH_Bact1]|nr:hypothetical protein QMT40_001800 [Parvibaculaceae bacterium PLY_AMNH_Bact1]